MKNTIFSLRGKAGTGKTTTIKIIYDLLKQNYLNANCDEIILKTDIKIIITINGIKIGIESQGDPNSRLEDSLKYFVENGCQIIICAARTRGMTNDWIKQYSNQFEIKWIEKQVSGNEENQNDDNQLQAKHIFEEINKLIQS